MSVAVIKSNYMHYGGGEKYAYHVVHAFAARGLATDVLTAEKGPWVEGEGIHRVLIPMFPTNNFLRLVSFNRGVQRYLERRISDYDCVLGMDRTVLQTHLRAGGGSHRGWLERRRRVSSAVRNASFSLNPFHRYMLRIEERSIRSPYLRRLICISNLVREDFLNFYDFDARRIAVIHNGVEWESLAVPFREALTAKDAIRSELGMQGDRFYFLYVGSGFERKGVRYIIRALRGMPAESALIVIGKDRNIGAYRAFAEREGVADRVQFLGPRKRDSVIRYLQASDAFVLPSLYEPFGSAALEALAMGLFTITSASTGCSEVLKEGCGTVVADPSNTDELSVALRTAMRHYDRTRIRDSVQPMSFHHKLRELIDLCLSS